MLQACPLAPEALGRIMELPVDTRQDVAILPRTGNDDRRRLGALWRLPTKTAASPSWIPLRDWG